MNDRLIKQLGAHGNYLGNHSFAHLLYCDWNNRDSLLVTKRQFIGDLMGITSRHRQEGKKRIFYHLMNGITIQLLLGAGKWISN